MANGESMLLDWCQEHFGEKMPGLSEEKYQDYLKKYFMIGGMPAAVAKWLETKDFSKHAPSNIVPKIHHIWNSIPSRLARENKKFIYGLAKEGARAREYEDAFLWLKDSGLIRRVGSGLCFFLIKIRLYPLRQKQGLLFMPRV